MGAEVPAGTVGLYQRLQHTGHPRLGIAVVNIPINTTIYKDAAGTKETRTIMRAELVAIHTALATFVRHNWICITTDSLSSLQARRHHHTNPGTKALLPTQAPDGSGLSTTLHKIRAHTNVRGHDLADAAAKLAVTHCDTLPSPQTRRVKTGETDPRPIYWVMYSYKPPPPLPALSTSTNCDTLRRQWWTIPEMKRLQMYAFTRPSSQPRLKVRDALLRSLNHSYFTFFLLIPSLPYEPSVLSYQKKQCFSPNQCKKYIKSNTLRSSTLHKPIVPPQPRYHASSSTQV